jgi:FkbM family methyltransferase
MNPEKQLTEYVQTWDTNQANHPLWQDYKEDFEAYFSKFKTSRESQEFSNLTFYPCLGEKTPSTGFDKSYYYQDTWASRKIFQSRPESVLDIGSTVLYSGIISQFVPTTFVDIRPIQVNLPGLTVVDGSILELPFEDYSQNFITSLCVMEHIGLGRYGDPIMPDGARRACAEINRVLKPGGEIVVSVPVGVSCIAYNAHRIFSREQFLSYLPGYTVLDEVFLTPEPMGSEVLDSLKEPGQFVVWVAHLAKTKNIEVENWIAQGKPVPTPHAVKQEAVRYHAEKYSLNTLVETGTYLGDMVFSMKDIFKKIISIELGSDLYLQARNRFWGLSHIDIIQGDSGQVFSVILPKISDSCLFWLDGHYSAGITARGDLQTPILQELQAIFSHSQKDNHVLLIDDARCFTGQDDYPNINELKELVSQHLPNHSWEIKDDIIRIYPAKNVVLIGGERDILFDDLISNNAKKVDSSCQSPGEGEVISLLINPQDVIFDIGASLGEWTSQVLYSLSNVNIHLFEPIPAIHENLRQNLADKINEGDLILNNMAVGCQEEVKNFFYYDKNSMLSTLYRREEVEKQGWLGIPTEILVEVTTVDSYCQRKGIERINFLKIDVEGGEFDVIRGAENLLQKGKVDYVQFEYGGTYNDAGITLREVFDYLQKFNYMIFKILSDRLEYIPHFNERYEDYLWSNFLAVNPSLKSRFFS